MNTAADVTTGTRLWHTDSVMRLSLVIIGGRAGL
jgi:hypothetical protein